MSRMCFCFSLSIVWALWVSREQCACVDPLWCNFFSSLICESWACRQVMCFVYGPSTSRLLVIQSVRRGVNNLIMLSSLQAFKASSNPWVLSNVKKLWVSCFKSVGFPHYFHMRFSCVLWLEGGLLVVTTTREMGNMREVVKKGLPNVKGWNQFFVRCKGK
jgi:hypothetical protein